MSRTTATTARLAAARCRGAGPRAQPAAHRRPGSQPDVAEGAREPVRGPQHRAGARRHAGAGGAGARHRRCGGADRDPLALAARRGPLHQQALPDHRREPVAHLRDLPVLAGKRPRRDRDACARRCLLARARHRRDQRRAAVRGDALREGLGRLLGAGRRRRAGGGGLARPDALSRRGRPEGPHAGAGPADDRPPQPFRSGDGPVLRASSRRRTTCARST